PPIAVGEGLGVLAQHVTSSTSAAPRYTTNQCGDAMSQPTTYVTQDMLDRRGVPGDRMVSPPVAASDIRKWAIAVYWPETPPPLFWHEEYAKTTPFGGIIAPHEFNPFAWPPERPADISQGPSGPATAPGTRPLHGVSDTAYHR